MSRELPPQSDAGTRKRARAPFAYFPAMLDLRGRLVAVVGGGRVGERKVRAVLDCGARVRLVATRATDGLVALVGLAASGDIEHLPRPYRTGDLEGAFIAFVAVDDPEASSRIAREARALGVPVNVVDQPGECDFIVPSAVRRGRLTIAISTGGASPAWARKLRERFEAMIGEEYARLFDALAAVRRRCLDEIADPVRRQRVLERLADESALEMARSFPRGEAEALEAELWKLAAGEAAT